MRLKFSCIDQSKFDIGSSHLYDLEYDIHSPIHLVKPKSGFTAWTEDTLCFRSSVWAHTMNNEIELISAGFPKFFNLNEKPEINPFPHNIDLKDLTLVEKVDGSCLIVSKYRNNLIVRTRGTFDATTLPNGKEINQFIPIFRKYKPSQDTWSESLLFEWYSPANKIIINYGDSPFISLIGSVRHRDYSLWPQRDLDLLALNLNVRRPRRFTFQSWPHLLDFLENTSNLEGVCAYYNNEQNIRKLKTPHYLKLHAFKGSLSYNSLMDKWLELKKPERAEFEEYILKTYDYECLEHAKPIIIELYDKVAKATSLILFITLFVNDNHHLDQKAFAALTGQSFAGLERQIAFSIRNTNEVTDRLFKKLLTLPSGPLN